MPKTGKEIKSQGLNKADAELSELSGLLTQCYMSINGLNDEQYDDLTNAIDAIDTLINPDATEDQLDKAVTDFEKFRTLLTLKTANGKTIKEIFDDLIGDPAKLENGLEKITNTLGMNPVVEKKTVIDENMTVTAAYAEKINRMTEVNNLPDHNPATNPREYIERNKLKRRANRSVDYAREMLENQQFDVTMIKHVMGKVAGQDYLIDQSVYLKENKDEYKHRMWAYIKRNKPELIAEIPENEYKSIGIQIRLITPYITKWKNEGKLTNADRDNIFAEILLGKVRYLTPDQEIRFVSELEKTMSEEQKKDFSDKLNAYVDIIDLPEEDKYEYPNRERANELKANIPAEIATDPVKKAKYEKALDIAGNKVRYIKQAISSEKRNEEKNSQDVEAKKFNLVREHIPEYENGKYHNLFITNGNLSDYQILDKAREKDLEDLYTRGIKFSDKTKEGMRLMIAKMKEMELEKYPHSPNGEDGEKVYGFNKIKAQRKALENALKEGDPDKIIEAGEKYEKSVKDYEELYRISKEYFSTDDTLYPGNMDSVRNTELPFEFTSDLANTARINAMFMNYINMAENNLDMEAYLDNPVKEIVSDAIDKFKEKSFANISKDVDLEEAIELMTATGRHNYAKEDFVTAVPIYGLPRQLSTPSYIENDKDVRESNFTYKEALNKDMLRIQFNGQRKFDYFMEDKAGEIGRRARIMTIQNLIIASDKKFNANAMMYGIPQTDVTGKVIGESFDAERYMQDKPVDYEGLIDRSEFTFSKIRDIKSKNGNMVTTADDVLEAMEQLYLNMLISHPEDKENPYYRKMQLEYINLYDRLSKDAPEDIKERMKSRRDSYIASIAVDKKPKAWEDPDFAVAMYMKKIPQPALLMLKNDRKTDDYTILTTGLPVEAVEDPEYAALSNKKANMFNYNPRSGSIYNYEELLDFNSPFTKKVKDKSGRIVKNLKKDLMDQSEKEKDPYAKRMEEDYIRYLTWDPTKFSTIVAEGVSYLNLFTLNATTVPLDGEKFSIEEAKEKLGNIFNDHLDLTHYGMEEIAIEIERMTTVERLNKEGKTWGPAEEKEYADKILKTHNAVIGCYERLNRNFGPGANTEGYLQNGIDHDLGRGEGIERDILTAVGKCRGEARALNMGWNTQDMAVLGYFGMFEKRLEKVNIYGTSKNKKGITSATKDLLELKEKIWNKKIETNADKKEIADALYKYVSKHKDCQAIRSCIRNYEAFENAINYVSKEAARTAEDDFNLTREKKNDPVEYLKKLEEKGDMRKFARELADMNALFKAGELEKKGESFLIYAESLTEIGDDNKFKKGEAFVESLHKELNKYYMEQNIILAKSADDLARDIRNGMSVYSEKLGNLSKDFDATNKIADNIVFNSKDAMSRNGANDLILRMNLKMEAYVRPDGTTIEGDRLSEKYKAEFLKDNVDPLTDKEREIHFNRATAKPADIENLYGIKIGQTGQLEIPDKDVYKQKSNGQIDSSLNDIVNYKTTVSEMIFEAKEKMTRLEELKAYKANNTKEFMAMYKAVKKIGELSSEYSPEEISGAIDKMEKASKAYVKAKIEDSSFAGRHGNGAERVAFANDMITFADEKGKAIAGKITVNIDIYDTVDRQAKSKYTIKEKTVREKTDINELREELEQENPVKQKRRNSITKTVKKIDPVKVKDKFNEI